MFWQKSFILLGLLAGVGSAAPTLSKRLDLDALNDEFVFFRADTRGPEEIKKSGGFQTKAKTNKFPENISLWDHCKVKEAKASFGNRPNDGYVSTSSDFGVCVKWVMDYIEDPAGSTIYKIASDRNLISYNPLPDEQEYAAINGIPGEQVMGWYDQFTVRGKAITDAVFTENLGFDKVKFNEIPDGSDESNNGANYRLAGCPAGDKRWKEEPWASATNPVCGIDEKPKKGKKKNSRRNVDDVDINEVNEVNEDMVDMDHMEHMEHKESDTESSEDKALAARARFKKPVEPTTPSGKQPVKQPVKPPVKPPTKPPVTSCTAAEKKANGGKCPTCTASEKKKNGGKCPPKACSARKTNKQFAEEYFQLYSAGKLGKPGAGKPAASKPRLSGKAL